MLAAKLLSSLSGATDEPLYVDDVFSTYLYNGNSATQTITNGIDLAGKGGMVWIKQRSAANMHQLFDTARGATNKLNTNATSAQAVDVDMLTAFNSDGFSLGADISVNNSGQGYVNWTFRKAPKFFDVVTYIGNGSPNQAIPHSLGIVPGMVIIKNLATSSWVVWHRFAPTKYFILNSAGVQQYASGNWGTTPFSDTNFYVGGGSTEWNTAGHNYVAYVFAHDDSSDGIIQCGSFTTNSTGNVAVNLGWEPQYLMLKQVNGAEDWRVVDMSRGIPVGSSDAILMPNSTAAETSAAIVDPTAIGFDTTAIAVNGYTYIYMAIRRPNKPPTVGTQVYKGVVRTGTNSAATVTGVGFSPDLVIGKAHTPLTGSANIVVIDRLRGVEKILQLPTTMAELNKGTKTYDITSFDSDGFSLGTSYATTLNRSANSIINWIFKRAPGVFDVVCYNGSGVAKTEAHSLGVVPELMIVKGRSQAVDWYVYAGIPTQWLILDSTVASAVSILWNNTAPTSAVFTISAATVINQSAATYVAYLFATKAGISKVGSYIGNGTSQVINCGFTTGSRFVLIKRTDAVGDWYVWDTARGIVAANDPHLSLNTTATEVTTDDSIDPDLSGFIVNQVAATNINVLNGTYIFLSFA